MKTKEQLVYEKKKEALIGLCDFYAKKKHIQTRHLFKLYKARLNKDLLLTQKMFDHMLVFMRRDIDKTDEELKNLFNDFIYTQPPSNTFWHTEEVYQ